MFVSLQYHGNVGGIQLLEHYIGLLKSPYIIVSGYCEMERRLNVMKLGRLRLNKRVKSRLFSSVSIHPHVFHELEQCGELRVLQVCIFSTYLAPP